MFVTFLNASILYGYVCEFKDIGLCYENVLLMFKIDKIEKKHRLVLYIVSVVSLVAAEKIRINN